MRPVFTGALCATLALGTGVALVKLGAPVSGGFMLLVGALVLAAAWQSRYLVPMDPQLRADIEEWLAIRPSDEAHADEMRRRIFSEARKREEKRLVQLRTRAVFDRGAAVELRARLREKLYFGRGVRRWVQRTLSDTPDGPAVLQALDRETSITRQRWLEAEQFL